MIFLEKLVFALVDLVMNFYFILFLYWGTPALLWSWASASLTSGADSRSEEEEGSTSGGEPLQPPAETGHYQQEGLPHHLPRPPSPILIPVPSSTTTLKTSRPSHRAPTDEPPAELESELSSPSGSPLFSRVSAQMERGDTVSTSLTEPSPRPEKAPGSTMSRVGDEGPLRSVSPEKVTSYGKLVLPLRATNFLVSMRKEDREDLEQYGVVKIMAAVGPIFWLGNQDLKDGEEGILLFMRDMEDDQRVQLLKVRLADWIGEESSLRIIIVPETELPPFPREPSAHPVPALPLPLPSLVLDPVDTAPGSFVTHPLQSDGDTSHSETSHDSKLYFMTEPQLDWLAQSEAGDQARARREVELTQAREEDLQELVVESEIGVKLDPVKTGTTRDIQICGVDVTAGGENRLRRVKLVTFNVQGLDRIKWSTHPYEYGPPNRNYSTEDHQTETELTSKVSLGPKPTAEVTGAAKLPRRVTTTQVQHEGHRISGRRLTAEKNRLARGMEFLFAPEYDSGREFDTGGPIPVKLTLDPELLEADENTPVVFGIDMISTIFSGATSRAYFKETDFLFQLQHTIHIPYSLQQNTTVKAVVVLQHTSSRATLIPEYIHASLKGRSELHTEAKGKLEVVENPSNERSGWGTSPVGWLRRGMTGLRSKFKGAEVSERGSGLTQGSAAASATIRIEAPDPARSS